VGWRKPARRAGQSGGAKTCRRAESGYRRICQDVTHSATPERRTFQLRPVWCCLFTLSGGRWLLRRGLRGAASSGPGPCRDPGSCFFSAEGSPGSVGEILYDPLSVQPPTVLALGSSHQRGRRWGDGWVVDHVQDLDPVEWEERLTCHSSCNSTKRYSAYQKRAGWTTYPTGAARTAQHRLDGPRLSCKQQVGGSSPPPAPNLQVRGHFSPSLTASERAWSFLRLFVAPQAHPPRFAM
jgi:hypothetical protein